MEGKVNIKELKGKIDDYEYCEKFCKKTCVEGSQKFCMDNKCKSTKKRLFTKKKNILERSNWRLIERKLDESSGKLFDRTIFPYLALEAVIIKSYDHDIQLYISQRLGIKERDLKKKGVKQIYELEREEAQRILESLVLKSLGLERSEKIVKIFK